MFHYRMIFLTSIGLWRVASDLRQTKSKGKIQESKVMDKKRIHNRYFCLWFFLLRPFALSPFRSLLFTLVILSYCCTLSDADFSYGPVSLSGNVQSQQILRHPEPEKWSIIQQRNVLRLRLEVRLDQRRASLRFSFRAVDSPGASRWLVSRFL